MDRQDTYPGQMEAGKIKEHAYTGSVYLGSIFMRGQDKMLSVLKRRLERVCCI